MVLYTSSQAKDKKQKRNRDVAQFGRAPALGAGSRRFKSCHLDQATSLMVALILTSAPSRVHI